MSAEIHVGFALVPLQLLDLAGPMDVLSNCSDALIRNFGHPEEFRQKGGKNLKFHYVGLDLEPVKLSGGFLVKPTCTVKDCPKLDYLLVGGPAPDYFLNVPKEMADFIRQKTEEVKTVFSTCTGGLVLAACGVLDGLEATANHSLLPMAAEHFGKVKWNNKKNWVVSGDGKFWTAAGAIAGMDMMSNWVQSNFGEDFMQFSAAILEYRPRDVNAKFVDAMNGRYEMVKS